MTKVIPLVLEFGAVLAIFAAAFATLLALRNPLRPHWLDREWIGSTATIAIVAAAIFIFAMPVKTLLALGLDPLMALTAVAATGMFSAWAMWRLFRIRERIAEADRGRSPFRRLRRRGRRGFGPGAVGHA